MSDRSWTPPGDLFRHLHRLAMLIGFYEHLFVSGHLSLGYYLDHQLIRPIDQIFTIVRHPVDIALSHANYVVTRLKADTQRGTFGPDTVQWLERLGIGVAEVPKLSPGELSLRILQDRNIIQPNSMCRWLGGRHAQLRSWKPTGRRDRNYGYRSVPRLAVEPVGDHIEDPHESVDSIHHRGSAFTRCGSRTCSRVLRGHQVVQSDPTGHRRQRRDICVRSCPRIRQRGQGLIAQIR